MTLPASVSRWRWRASSPVAGRLSGAERLPARPFPPILAKPKSAIFTRPRRSSRMFSGLMSRWTMPWSWAYWSASQICGTMASASRGETRPACEQLPQVHAVHEFHEEVKQPVRSPELIDGDDAGMVQPGQRLGLAGEPLGKCRVVRRRSGGRIFSATSRSSCFCRAL